MKEVLLGGQAVIEGVMMKGPKNYAVAVRKNDGSIIVDSKPWSSVTKKSWLFRMPIVRGVISLFEMMVLGIKTLTYSANISAEEDNETLSGWEIFFTISVSLLFSVILFVILPLFLSRVITQQDGAVFNIIDGIIRIGVFVAYVLIIGQMKDVKRLFQYHGAEHKTVHAYEAKKKLTVANVKRYSILHPRCGTSFVFIVLIISILVFSIVDSASLWGKFLIRIALIPLIAGISYEILKISAKKKDNILFKFIVFPGLMVQRLTTKEPDNKQIEVAIESLKKVYSLEKKANSSL